MDMLLNGSENEKLFAKSVLVSVKNKYTNDFRMKPLCITMEWQEPSSSNYRKVLSITLTDDDDIYFLYNLQLSEEDFQTLKNKQDLLINFSSFPQHIIDYIEMCLLEEKNPEPKFSLFFSQNDKPGNVAASSKLDIIERNQFKNLIHLSLDFIGATDTCIKQYQASLFRCLKEENKQLQRNLTSTECELKSKAEVWQRTLNSKIEEFEAVRKQLNEELTLKENNHQRELQEERNRLTSRHKNEIDRLEKEMAAKEYNFRKEIQQFESRVNVLDSLNKDLQDKNFKHESTIRELQSKIYSLEDELKHLKENLQSFKYRCDHLQSEVKKEQSQIHQKDEIINDLKKQLKNKEQSLLKLKDQIKSEIELKKKVENELEDIKFRFDLIEKQQEVLQNDKERLNEVIFGLQEKINELTKEEKTKNHLVTKYKKTVEEKEKVLLNMRQEIANLNISLQSKNVEIKSLCDSNSSLEKKLEDFEKLLKNKDNVIKWMNRQMTDNCIVPQYIPPPHLTSPSALAQKQLAKISLQSPENPSPGLNTGTFAAAKSVRIEAASPVCRQKSSIPSRINKTAGTDSAYCTASLNSNQATPEVIAGNHNMNFDSSNFEIDQEALSAAFGNGGQFLKHSTAKKPTKPVKSTTPKSSKKR